MKCNVSYSNRDIGAATFGNRPVSLTRKEKRDQLTNHFRGAGSFPELLEIAIQCAQATGDMFSAAGGDENLRELPVDLPGFYFVTFSIALPASWIWGETVE